jgi:ABC-2 type transport system permease protein
VAEPSGVRRADGRWEVSVPVEARKLYVEGAGAETEAALAEQIAIGLFTDAPGRDAFEPSKVILMERRPMRSGSQVLTFVTDTRPTHAGIDPYGFYIDRDSTDNVQPVK